MSNPVIPAAPAATVDPAATAVVEPVIEPAAAEPQTAEQLLAELTTWKGHARTWENRSKENKAAADKLAEIEAANLTETQRLQLELDALKTERDQANRTALVSGIAAAKGVPANLLTGSTAEELEAAADALLAFRGVIAPPANDVAASGALGAPITAGAQITSLDALKGMTPAERLQAKADGRLSDLLAGKK